MLSVSLPGLWHASIELGTVSVSCARVDTHSPLTKLCLLERDRCANLCQDHTALKGVNMWIQDDDVIELPSGRSISGKAAKEVLNAYCGVKDNSFSAMFFKDDIILGKSPYVKKEIRKRSTRKEIHDTNIG